MKNEKLLKLAQKLQIDSDDSEGISNLSYQFASQVRGGGDYSANDVCNNSDCSSGRNTSCTNTNCTGTIINGECSNPGCF